MLTSKQRAELRAMGNTLEAIVQIGKGGINDNLIRQMDDALTARELVKATFWRPPRTLPGRPPSSWRRPPVRRWCR